MITHSMLGKNLATGKNLHRPMLASDPAMLLLRLQAEAVGKRCCPTVIHGESGTGKELLAHQIHLAGPRAAKPFIPVDCSTLRDTLLESQLFGHVRGAFTGAACSTIGLLQAADGGTLFLDEIGELPLSAQSKLLRCLQEREVVPLGSWKAVPVDVSVLCATHRSLTEMVGLGTFRADLYFRLNVVTLRIPPLRDRRGDIPLLTTAFLAEIAARFDESLRTLSDEALERLMDYHWPGNVRELRNLLERACALTTRTTLQPHDFPLTSGAAKPISNDPGSSLCEIECNAIASALRTSGGNQTAAALALHVERHRLRRLITRHGLESLIA